MTVSLTHSTPADGTFSATGATAWDAQHVLTQDTARLLGRTTAGVGATEEISVGTGLSLSGGTLTNTVTATAPGGSDTQLQYNNAGAFGGASGLTTNGTELTIASGTKTASAPVLDMSQTWNNSGVTFTGLKFNAATGSSANSAAGSLLMDLQLEGVSRFGLGKAGNILGVTATAANPHDLNRGGTGRFGFYQGTGYVFTLGYTSSATGDSGTLVPIFSTQGSSRLLLTRDIELTWTSITSVASAGDLVLTRRAAANLRLGAADVGATTATVTITIATPGVVTWSNHGFSTGTPVVFTTTGALPTGITSGTTYYAVVVDANTLQLASSVANAIAATPTVITTSGSQSGTHTGTRYNITQRLSMQSNTGVTDRLGADLIITGSQGTGTGAGGSIIFQVAPAGSTGSAQNALATALTIGATEFSVSYGQATPFLSISSGGIAQFRSNNPFYFSDPSSTNRGFLSPEGARFGSGQSVGWDSSTAAGGGARDLALFRDAANTLALRNGTNAQTFNVYNTFTSSTNFERFRIVAQSAAAVLIGTQKGSAGGTARALELQTDATSRLTLDTVGSAQIVTALTVATLPATPLTGMIARVTDALAPAVGVTVAAGGAAQALCWYNGANWTVIGV